MPIYEFVCEDCGKTFEELLRDFSSVEKVVCPSCQSKSIRRKVSIVASRAAGGLRSMDFGSTGCSTGST